ncbi:DUF397 domain-containing protein [Streptosporangium sp. NPDC087985]|uniref:DUF397 domain-containing protein n=1 Tax=Streptosporangium sp. NPDC087985 TaxID=3366196 RepID=UPI0038306C45
MPSEQAVWRTSSLSANGADCVQVAVVDGSSTSDREAGTSLFLVRDSKNPDGPRLRFSPDGWAVFVDGIKAGDFDSLG